MLIPPTALLLTSAGRSTALPNWPLPFRRLPCFALPPQIDANKLIVPCSCMSPYQRLPRCHFTTTSRSPPSAEERAIYLLAGTGTRRSCAGLPSFRVRLPLIQPGPAPLVALEDCGSANVLVRGHFRHRVPDSGPPLTKFGIKSGSRWPGDWLFKVP